MLLVMVSSASCFNQSSKLNPGVISSGLLRSYGNSMDTDSKGIPHLVWSEDGQIVYVKIVDNTCLTASGEIYEPIKKRGQNIGFMTKSDLWELYPKIKIDSKDNPHIIWTAERDQDTKEGGAPFRDVQNIYYTKWDGENWVTAAGEIMADDSSNARMTSYTFESESLDISFTLDEDDSPHIVWHNDRLGKIEIDGIKYIHWDGQNWVNANGEIYDSQTNNAAINSFIADESFYYNVSDPKIDFDRNGIPYVSWTEDFWHDNKTYGRRNNSPVIVSFDGENWKLMDGSPYDSTKLPFEYMDKFILGEEGFPVRATSYSLLFDENNVPNLFYSEYSDGVFHSKYVDNKWENQEYDFWYYEETENNEKVFTEKRLDCCNLDDLVAVLDSNHNPHVVWYDEVDDVLTYIKWNGEYWENHNKERWNRWFGRQYLTKKDDFSGHLSMSLDNNNNLHLMWTKSYKFPLDGEILYIKWNGKQWVCADGTPYKEETEANPAPEQ